MNKTMCAALIVASALGVLGYEYVNDEPERASESLVVETIPMASGLGFVDLERIMAADVYGEKFSHLDEREHFVRLELQNAMRPIVITEPVVDAKPFDDSVWQKNAQTIISEAAEIERRKKQAAEEYRKATEADYLKRRDEINEQFLNEILNIKLKLQNAKVMRLTDKELDALESRLDALRLERGKIQRELEEQWVQEIAAHADDVMREEVENLRAQAQESMERVKAQARAEQEAAQARDRAVMERAQAMTARRELQQSLSNELEEIAQEREQLHAQLIKDIEDETVRLAVVNNLEAILLRRELEGDEKFYPYDFNDVLSIDFMPKATKPGAVILASQSSLDLTDEIIRELRTRRR